MLANRSFTGPLFVLLVLSSVGAAQDASLPEDSISSLIELQIEDEAIIARIKKGGLAFAPDDAALARLKKAGASEAVLDAIREAGIAKKPPQSAITYADVRKLLSLGVEEDAILKRLQKSPTLFTLDKQQTAELKKLGATERLLSVMAGERASAPDEQTGDVTDFAIVLDCSGSMLEQMPDGQAKMIVAKQVVADLVRRVPNGLRLTLITYGQDKAKGCASVAVVRQLSVVDESSKSELAKKIAAFKGAGATPIALALKTAGKELAKNDAACGLVLITDGKETCKGDPVAEAGRLADELKLTFGAHVVGFDINPDEREALAAIAKAGHGQYFNAETADQLSDSIASLIEQLEKKGRPAEVKVTQRRAVKVEKPEIEEFPAAVEIRLQSYGLGSTSVDGKAGFDQEIRIPSPKTEYDVLWVPKQGIPVPIGPKRTYPERELVVLKPEEHLGLVRVNGTGKPKRIMVYKHGLGSILVAQECSKYGELMVVPVGTWNIRVDDNELEEDFEVEPGKLHDLE